MWRHDGHVARRSGFGEVPPQQPPTAHGGRCNQPQPVAAQRLPPRLRHQQHAPLDRHAQNEHGCAADLALEGGAAPAR
jgi:hypothetical protein